jgi:autophagy-related protein 27
MLPPNSARHPRANRLVCPVCGIRHEIREGEGAGHGDVVDKIIPIAGDLADHGGKALDYEVSPLKGSESHSDSQKGLRLVLKGGAYPLDASDGKKEQRAIIDFICNKDKTGLEGEWKGEDEYEKAEKVMARDDDKEKEGDDKKDGKDGKDGDGETSKETQLLKPGAALKFVSYGTEKDDENLEILRLTWETKYACEGMSGKEPDEDAPSSTSHWGFFTWLFIM